MANLLFDYDGTIHDSIKIYGPAFRLAYARLTGMGLAEERDWSDREISRWLGYSSRDMWDAFMPGLPRQEKDACSEMIGAAMLRSVGKGQASLYPSALDVLEKLVAEGHSLIFLSNCRRAYMEAHMRRFNLARYFCAFYCTEDFGFQPKWEIFRTIIREHPGFFVVIGDRFQDLEIAVKHGLPSIGCAYGYGSKGELMDASAIAQQIGEIPSLAATILRDA